MPFNMAMLGVGGRIFILNISAEDLASNYNIESAILSAYSISNTLPGDIIQLNIAAVNIVAANTSVYAIDGNDLNSLALLTIALTSGALIAGRGGVGGKGGNTIWDNSLGDLSGSGSPGLDGGTAIRLGCETNIIGTGTITKGFGGGGGGGAGADSGDADGGGGGGGGSALANGGAKGIASGDSSSLNEGFAGSAGTVSVLGAGGAAGGPQGGPGGGGGDSGTAQQAGSAGTRSGGAAGGDGDAMNSQGNTHSEGGGITVVGAII